MITIKKPYIDSSDLYYSRLCAEIIIDKSIHHVFFEVEKEYEDYLCYERSDAFFIGILHFAFSRRHDIVCEQPISTELYYNVMIDLLPTLVRHGKKSIIFLYLPK